MELKFRTYDSQNIEHLLVAKELISDFAMKEITGSLITNVLTKEEEAFFVELEGIIIGLIDFNYYQDGCYITYGVLQNKRGFGFGTLILNYIKDYIFQTYPKAKTILLKIEPDNLPSINAALKAGYFPTGNQQKYRSYSFALTRGKNN